MNRKKMALLGAVVAFVAVVGAGAFNAHPVAAQAPSTKICTPTGGGTFPFNPPAFPTTLNCELSINSGTLLGIIPAGTSIQVTLAGGATFANVSYIGSCGGGVVTLSAAAPTLFPGPGFTFPAGTITGTALAALPGGATTYFVNVGGAIGCLDGTIRISEVISVPGPVAAGTITQTLTPVPGFNPGGLVGATIVATGPGGAPLVITLTTPFGGVTPGGPFPVTITSNGCSVGTAFVVGTTVLSATPGQTVTCRFDLDDNEPGFLATSVAGVTTGTTTCTTATATFPTQAAITAGGATAIAASECVSSGTITATLIGTLTGFAFSATGGTGAGTTAAFRCPGGTVTAANACDFVDITFTSTTATPLAGIGTVRINYDPDIDAQNTGADAQFNVISFVVAPIAANIPARLVLACVAQTGFIGTIPGVNTVGSVFAIPGQVVPPGQIGTSALLAVGILPGAVTCTVRPVDAAGNNILIPAGTFEVSSLNGALIDASGRLSTNLRIGCADPTVAGTGVLAPVNTCAGVTFSVAGVGVGITEIRVRYEPNVTVVGLNEIEVAGAVAFVAPTTTLGLTLSPNPVAVGATGTATVNFSPLTGLACSTGTTIIFCVDPTTGLPIASNTGSLLNGTVVLTIDNTAIARFTSGSQAVVGGTTTTTTTTTGVTNTTTAVGAESGSVVLRCGALSAGTSSTFSTTTTLGGFFGGCNTASATYRGITAGSANITATFFPDLPGAVSSSSFLGAGLTPIAFTGFGNLNFGGFSATSITRTLQVLDAAPTGNINLVRGCNNVTPTVTESVSAFIARAMNTTVISVWEYQAATNTFVGAPGPGAPAGAPGDLAGVNRLRPVFICVTGPGTLNQPAA